jgi:predicted permease
MEERPGSAWFGLPAMFAYAIAAALIWKAASLVVAIIAVVGVFVIFLAIGLAMTIAKRS